MTLEEAKKLAYLEFPEEWYDDSYPGEEPVMVDSNSLAREAYIKHLLTINSL